MPKKATVDVKVTAPSPKPQRMRKRRQTSSNGKMMGVATAFGQRSPKSTSYNREVGRDRYAFIEDVSTLPAQSIAIQQNFTPHSVSRLRVLSSAFQRVKYNSLRFTIEPQLPTSTAGGYSAAFIRDPSDVVPKGVAGLNRISANTPSCAGKWWETTTLQAPRAPDLLYTSSKQDEPRWSSPGTFVLGVEGKATQRGSLTIYVEYDVVFSEPSLEGEGEDDLVRFSVDCTTAGATRNIVQVGEKTTKASVILPGSRQGDIYTFNGPRYYARNKSGAFDGMVGFLYLKHTDDDYLVPCQKDGTLYNDIAYGDSQLFWAGESAMQVSSSVKGELVGSQFLCLPKLLSSSEKCLSTSWETLTQESKSPDQ